MILTDSSGDFMQRLPGQPRKAFEVEGRDADSLVSEHVPGNTFGASLVHRSIQAARAANDPSMPLAVGTLFECWQIGEQYARPCKNNNTLTRVQLHRYT